jgi:hypothetical protein
MDGMQVELSISPEQHGELSHVLPWDSLLRQRDRWWPPEATKEREKREGKRNVSSSSSVTLALFSYDPRFYDRQIKICGENNDKVAKRYRNCLPGDSPELMPFNNHVFADLQEGAAKNIALIYHIRDGDPDAPLKYSFATPRKVDSSIQRTIKAGCPSASRIAEDINRIHTETLRRIIDAKETCIEDYSSKSTRHGVRAEAAAAAKKRETLPVDTAMMNVFHGMVKKMKDSGGVRRQLRF